MINYPSSLPLPRLKDAAYKRQPNILRTEMSTGRARQRRKHLSVPTLMEATWRLRKDEATVFEGFVDDGVNLIDWFLMDILTPRGVVKHQVRFMKDPLENMKPISALVWQYKAQIEMKEYKAASEEEAVVKALAPNTFEEFVNGVESALSTYQEN